MTLLGYTETIRVIAQDYGCASVVVSFNEAGFSSTGLGFWGQEFLAKHRISAVGVVTSSPSWYAPSEMARIVSIISRYLGDRNRITFGFGQGGYGALKYSQAVNAFCALAFSPQWSIDPADVGHFDGRFTRHFVGEQYGGGKILRGDVGPRAFCFVDRGERPDLWNVERIPRVTQVAMPFTRHGSIGMIAEAGLGARLLRYCLIQGQAQGSELRNMVRSARRLSQAYLNVARGSLLLRALRMRGNGIAFLARVNRFCRDHVVLFDLVIDHIRDPNGGKAQLIDKELSAGSLVELRLEALVGLLFLTRELGLFRSEARIAALLIAVAGWKTEFCLHAVDSFVRVGLLEIAEAQLKRIVSANWDSNQYVDRITGIRTELGLDAKKSRG